MKDILTNDLKYTEIPSKVAKLQKTHLGYEWTDKGTICQSFHVRFQGKLSKVAPLN